MRDFTLGTYRLYLESLLAQGFPFLSFRDFMSRDTKPEQFCLVRHDVDRLPKNAFLMARLEAEMGVVSTYYFRTKPHTFQPATIRAIADMGHEIGYHYESLSDTKGDIAAAIVDFRHNLARLREVTDIQTCSMHGRPLRPFDNRDIWRNSENHLLLKQELGLIGEVYLDIDYADMAYINDTGRNWTSGVSNRRDKVNSNVPADFQSGSQLLDYLRAKPHPRMVFQVHPERWSHDFVSHLWSLGFDSAVNTVKRIV